MGVMEWWTLYILATDAFNGFFPKSRIPLIAVMLRRPLSASVPHLLSPLAKSAAAGEGGRAAVLTETPLFLWRFPFGSVCVSKARCVLRRWTATNNYQLLRGAVYCPRLLVFINNPDTLWISDTPFATGDQLRPGEDLFSMPNDQFCQCSL